MSIDKKKNKNINYNTFLNLPKEIYLTGGRWIKNTYLGDGTLVKRTFSNGEIWEYNNGLIFKNGEFYSLDIPDGRMIYSNGSWQMEFYYEDHLGNKRVIFAGESGTLVKKDAVDFDPWGVRLNGIDYSNSFANRFKFQGKEKIDWINWHDFGTRMYSAPIGMFLSIDPKATERAWLTPYNFVQNNPINRIDPDGALDDPIYDRKEN